MTVGRRQYNEAEMMQMQREAEARVREMQSRARQTVQEANESGGLPPPQGRNWNSNPGMFRRPRRPGNMNGQGQQARQGSQGNHSGQNGQGGQENHDHPGQQPQGRQNRQPEPPPPAPPPPEERGHDPAAHMAGGEAPKKDGTIIGDIMNALGLDEDYLLIIGLILILINQRADTTLILALAYLLI